MTAETETDWAAKIGKPAYECIAVMVAALECDYDRLEELRGERDDADEHDDQPGQSGNWELDNPDDAEELKELEAEAGECKDREDAETRIHEDPLSVRIFGERIDGEWVADKAEILLSTGGPAVRIMCELDGNGEPHRAYLEVQDWFKLWTQYFQVDGGTLVTYCQQFLFAE